MRVSLSLAGERNRTIARASRPRRWMLIPLALLIAVGGGAWWISSRGATATTTTTTATVGQGSLTSSVSGSGSVAAARTVDLTFQQSGTVTAVDVKIGDAVRAGQSLATIDSVDLQLALQQAQANLKAAQATLAATQNGSATPQDLASAQASLDSAQAQLQQTKTGTATKADIQSAQAALAAAQAKLDALKNPSAATLSSAQTKIDQAQTSLQSTQNSASQAKTNAQLALQNSVNALTQAQSKFGTAQSNWQHVQDEGTDPINPTTTSSDGTKKANKLNSAQRQSYYDTFLQAQAALDSAQNAVTQAQVAYDSARQSEITQVRQAEATLKDAQQTLSALQNPSASDVTQAQVAVTQAQASLAKLTQGGTAAEIAQSQAGVVQAQASLDKLIAPPTDAELTASQASVLQAQAAVDTAQRNLDAATLKAPFDGVISAVGLQVGSTSGGSSSSTASTSTSGITLVDRSKLHIDVSLSETDAAKVTLGQPVTLTFDALPNVTLNGTVATVSPAATTSQNVVTYPVQIEFDPGQAAVKVGMSATADIQVQKVDNAILVPSRAIQTSGTSKAVTVLQGPQRTPARVPVTTGITSNGQTQIVSSGGNGAPALEAGDVLSIPATTTTTTTTTTNNRGSFGGGGFGGPPPGQ